MKEKKMSVDDRWLSAHLIDFKSDYTEGNHMCYELIVNTSFFEAIGLYKPGEYKADRNNFSQEKEWHVDLQVPFDKNKPCKFSVYSPIWYCGDKPNMLVTMDEEGSRAARKWVVI